MKSMPLLVFVLFASGCAPLSQAPLVYSSRQSLGVHISITNPETPGAQLDVGFNNKDMAIVPVAVAKLPKSIDGNAGNTNIQLVKATYSGSVNPAAVDAAIAALREAEKDFDEKSTAFQQAQVQSDDYSAKKAELDKLSQQLATLSKDKQALMAVQDTANSQAIEDNQALLNATQTQIDKLDRVLSSQEKAQIISNLDHARTQKDNAEKRMQAAMTELEKVEGKTDAYSVFGSFDNGNKLVGSEKSANVTLGKMFSTGVAAQNVSQGMAKKACLDSLRSAVTGTVTADQAQSMCGTK
jgi:hypothetical protein